MRQTLGNIKKRINLLLVVQLLTLFAWMFLVTLQWLISPKIDVIIISLIVKVLGVKAITIFIVSFFLYKIYDKLQHRRKTWLIWLMIVLLIIISSYVGTFFENTILHVFKIKDVKIISSYFYYKGTFFITPLLLLSVVYFAVRYWENAQMQKENTLKSEALAHEAQLQMLRYQINPHFLFNALNTLSLIHI